jgi:hypothetical protein
MMFLRGRYPPRFSPRGAARHRLAMARGRFSNRPYKIRAMPSLLFARPAANLAVFRYPLFSW